MDGFYRNISVSSEMRACETKKVDNGYGNLTLFGGYSILLFDLYPANVYEQHALCCYIFDKYNYSLFFNIDHILFIHTNTPFIYFVFVQYNVEVDVVIVNYRM